MGLQCHTTRALRASTRPRITLAAPGAVAALLQPICDLRAGRRVVGRECEHRAGGARNNLGGSLAAPIAPAPVPLACVRALGAEAGMHVSSSTNSLQRGMNFLL